MQGGGGLVLVALFDHALLLRLVAAPLAWLG